MSQIPQEVQYALTIAVIGALCTILIFLWGMLDLRAKVKKIDQVDSIGPAIDKLNECANSLTELIRRQDVSEAVSKQEFRRMSQEIADLKVRVWRLEQRGPREIT
jgi:hypothetical protein